MSFDAFTTAPATVDVNGLADAGQIAAAVALLRQGELVAFPTETVYGLGADAEDPVALDRLYTVKGRPKGHPVIVHLASVQQLQFWAEEIPDAARKLAEVFWPGPLTLILKRSARVPDAVTGGQNTVGLRVPAHPVALQLLRAFGGGIAAPSANRFGRLSPTRAAHVQTDLGDDVSLILDGGDCPVGVESTIVAFRDDCPVILRPGMITAEQIELALASGCKSLGAFSESSLAAAGLAGKPAIVPPETAVIRAPGTLASHYAPHTPLRLVASRQLLEALLTDMPENGRSIGILARGLRPEALTGRANLQWVALVDEPEAYARQLYARLRELDQRQLAEIWVEAVPDGDAWAAVSDRLCRAAHQG